MTKENIDIKTLKNNDNEPLTFARDVIWVGLSLVFTSLLGIIALPILTKSYNSEIYGIWSQVSVTVSLVTPLLTLQFGTAVVRFLAGEENKEKRRRYMGSMLFAILAFSCIVFLTANVLGNPLSNFLFDAPLYTNFIRLTFLWTLVDSLFIFAVSYLRARNKIKKLSLIQIVFISSKIVSIITLPLLGLGLEWVIVSIIAIETFFTAGVFYLIIKDIGFPKPNTSGLSTFLAFSAPQIPSGVLLWIISASDRYFITHFLGLSQTGIYSSSYLLAGVITLFYAPIGFVLLPVITIAWEQKRILEVKNYLEYSTKVFLTLAIPAAAIITILSQPLLTLLTTTEFLAGWELVLLVSIGAIFLGIYQINLYIIYLVKQTKWLPLMILGASFISVIINYLLIPRIGILGAAISNASAYFVLAAIVTIWAKKAISYHIDFKYLSKVTVAVLAMSIALNFFDLSGVLGILTGILLGIVIIVVVMVLLRAVNGNEKRLLRKTILSFLPWIN